MPGVADRGTSAPRLTVIVNSYNYAAYLGQAIDSALQQDYADKEVIVVDDGSTDASPEIIRSYGAAITPVFHENLGQARTCLRAVAHATGDYILFLDSDDYLLPGALTAVAAVCAPGVAKVQFQLLPVGPEGEPVGRPWPAMGDQSRADLLQLIERQGTYAAPPNSGNVHRADIFNYIGDIDYENSIDGVPYLVAPLLGEVRQIARALGCYRYHATNFSDHGKLNPVRFALEAQRHKERLHHLKTIAAENGLPIPDITDPDHHSYVHTREILAKASGGHRPSVSLVLRYVSSLLRERHAPGLILKLSLWAIAMQLSGDRSRRKLAIYRSDPRSRRR
ncbi:glycosyltransferase family 2 protein [Glacieibacterium megasporae]|uniref:glycosyltransferase family 2 protein n=1 Tax=Glacieibacterium megasporae TaxID=2835787 RepID=UPI001C1E5400|nr:glycosyltransferase family A protein [Polymorphobacter megasporae]UAJ08755.1 glycosyltransferase family 2 protein [Polymorphobacter megasporae]